MVRQNEIENNFLNFLFKVIYNLLKNNILFSYNVIKENDVLNDLIIKNLVNDISFSGFHPKFSQKLNIYINLKIPKSNIYLPKLIKYVKNELAPRYYNTEGKLRKVLSNNEIPKVMKNYYNEIKLYEENINNEINKYEFISVLFQGKNDLKKYLTQDYLYFFIDNIFEKENLDDIMGEKLFSFIKYMIKLKFEESHKQFEFDNSLEQFQKIVLFTQGYEDAIKKILTSF